MAPTICRTSDAIGSCGLPATGDVVTSALAAALLVEPGETVHVCGGPGIVEALERRGARVSNDEPGTAVVVGINRRFDYDTLRLAAAAVRDGARLIGTNDDATYPYQLTQGKLGISWSSPAGSGKISVSCTVSADQETTDVLSA